MRLVRSAHTVARQALDESSYCHSDRANLEELKNPSFIMSWPGIDPTALRTVPIKNPSNISTNKGLIAGGMKTQK